jgi:hypothetical protein
MHLKNIRNAGQIRYRLTKLSARIVGAFDPRQMRSHINIIYYTVAQHFNKLGLSMKSNFSQPRLRLHRLQAHWPDLAAIDCS